MRCNLEWLRQWLPIKVDAEALGNHLTMAGLELDAAEAVCDDLSGVVVARVIAVNKHPNADKLKLCQVDIGEPQLRDVVCGASNVCSDMLTAYAPSGAHIGESQIAVKNIRGCNSDGMLCSAYELGMAHEQEGLLELDDTAEVGVSLVDYMRLDDVVYDIDLTPNRADCLSILGVARELSAILDLPVKDSQWNSPPESHCDVPQVKLLQPDACPRYLAREIRAIDVQKTTPLWIRERLRRCGIRAIYPVVDILNYVMLELGQPMHAFDKRSLKGALHIRWSEANEKLKILGGQTIELDWQTLVIADEQQAIAIAGIVGGEHSAVRSDATEIVLESAFFTPEAISGRARHYGLHTESSHRFERGVDFELQSKAMEYASHLIATLLDAEVGPTVEIVSREHIPTRIPIALNMQSVSTYLGVEIKSEFIEKTLENLGCKLEANKEGWQCTPPSYRFDLAIAEDLIEEVARIYGYERIPEISGSHTDSFNVERSKQHLQHSGDYLNARGYFEVITYSFVAPEQLLTFTPDVDIATLQLKNPVSEQMSVMRTSLWPGLLQVLKHNLNRQQDRVCIFEQGAKFLTADNKIEQSNVLAGLACGTIMPNHWSDKSRCYDFYDVKGDLQNLLQAFEGQLKFKAGEYPGLHSGQCADIYIKDRHIGCVGALSPLLTRQYKLHAPTFLFELQIDAIGDAKLPHYRAIPAYPSVRRDLAFVVAKGINATEILEYIDTLDIGYLVDRFIFDAYEDGQLGEGVKNVGIGFIFQDTQGTLQKETVDDLIQTLTDEICKRFSAECRLG